MNVTLEVNCHGFETLMETAVQMGQMKKNLDLRKALMSEAASRSIALHRRNDITWT